MQKGKSTGPLEPLGRNKYGSNFIIIIFFFEGILPLPYFYPYPSPSPFGAATYFLGRTLMLSPFPLSDILYSSSYYSINRTREATIVQFLVRKPRGSIT
jgi:hypothetical protein